MIIEDSRYCILNYLYDKGDVAQDCTDIEKELALDKLTAQNLYSRLVAQSFVKGFCSEEENYFSLYLMPKGRIYIEDEREKFQQEIIDRYDFALMKFLYRVNKLVALEDFPEELKIFAPQVENSINDGNLIHSLYRLQSFIENTNSGKYQLTAHGKKYYERAVAENKKVAKHSKRQIHTDNSIKIEGNFTGSLIQDSNLSKSSIIQNDVSKKIDEKETKLRIWYKSVFFQYLLWAVLLATLILVLARFIK